MPSFCVKTFVVLIMLAAGAWGAGNDLDVNVSLAPTSIGLDQQAVLEVRVEGASQDLPEPDLPTLPTIEVYSQGRSSNYSWINGQVSSSVTYRYLLLPQKPGKFPIEPISVVYEGRRYTGNVVELTVLNQSQPARPAEPTESSARTADSRDYFLEAAVDKSAPYVNDQVLLTLRFCTAVQYYGSPELAEPTTTGFWTEVIGNKAPYYQNIGGRRYKVIERLYALFPTQTGELTIGPATITATVATNRRQTRDPFGAFNDFFGRGEEVAIRSRALAVKVKALPQSGRPADFSGTVGQFDMRAHADKTQVEMNQPVTVSIMISGTGNIKSVAEPAIPESEDFRVYRASSSEKTATANDRLGGTKVFEEVFVPRRPGSLEIPALQLTYFDSASGGYQTVSTQPIRLVVTKPEGYVSSPEVPYSGPSTVIGVDANDIRHIKADLGEQSSARRVILLEPVYLVVNTLPILVLVGSVLWRRHRERLSSNSGLVRSRAASKVARGRLQKARSLAALETVSEFHAEIYRALTSYVADKLNISPHGLTSDRVAELLRERGAGEDLVAQTIEVMRRCDFARFAPATISQADIERLLREAEEVMTLIEEVRFA
jgi:hypothetical protein